MRTYADKLVTYADSVFWLADNVFMLTDGHFGLRTSLNGLRIQYFEEILHQDSILRVSLRVCVGYKADLVIRTQLVKPDISIGHMTIFGKF